jgi:hypothetical protein
MFIRIALCAGLAIVAMSNSAFACRYNCRLTEVKDFRPVPPKTTPSIPTPPSETRR